MIVSKKGSCFMFWFHSLSLTCWLWNQIRLLHICLFVLIYFSSSLCGKRIDTKHGFLSLVCRLSFLNFKGNVSVHENIWNQVYVAQSFVHNQESCLDKEFFFRILNWNVCKGKHNYLKVPINQVAYLKVVVIISPGI